MLLQQHEQQQAAAPLPRMDKALRPQQQQQQALAQEQQQGHLQVWQEDEAGCDEGEGELQLGQLQQPAQKKGECSRSKQQKTAACPQY
jgi:hypothetical protein